jgi:hypothetical protein
VAVILCYLSLDLCLAWMPGAFVFDVADSVESAVMSRARQLLEPAPAALATAAGGYEPVAVRQDTSHVPAWSLRRPRAAIAEPEVTATVTPAAHPDLSAEDPH